jgi:hypothetical protein
MVNRPTFGLRMAEMSSDGFPVLGRIELSPACEGDAVTSATLGAPIIFGGHHECAAGGLDLLSDCAAFLRGRAVVQPRNNTAVELPFSAGELQAVDTTVLLPP